MISAKQLFFICYFGYLFLLSLVALILYYADKQKAIKGKYRIPEAKLLGISWMGGALGAFLGMRLFRHKTKHLRFCVMVPVSLILWIGISTALWILL